MSRTLGMPAVLALGAALTAGQSLRADDTIRLGSSSGPSVISGGTVTLGGTGKVAEAAAAGDVELAHCRKYGYAYGYGGYYYGGYYGGYRPYYGGVTVTYYAGGYGHRHVPYYVGGYRPYYAGYHGYYRRFGADDTELQAPTINLGAPVAATPIPTTTPLPDRNAKAPGTFHYDGGLAVPVPMPSTNPQPLPRSTPATNEIPVSLKPHSLPNTTPYKYKAYGEK